ncbi:IclR family transcriptional regulator [Pigmentiphaga soli]
MKDEELRTVAAVERALHLLDTFRSARRALTLTEIAARTGLYKSTALRLAATLERFGYLLRRPDGAYQIGSTPFYLGAVYQQTTQPAEIILPALRELVAEFGESASFFIERDGLRLCLYRVNSPQLVRAHLSPGDIVPMDKGAAGKIMMAFREPFDPAYARIRKNLVVSSAGEVALDMSAVAAAVFDAQGIAGALAITGPQRRFNRGVVRRAEAQLLKAAFRITQGLGGDMGRFSGPLALVAADEQA